MHEQSYTSLSNNVPDLASPIEKIVNYTIDSYFGLDNQTGNITTLNEENSVNNWWALVALMLVVCTAAGNVLVCLAIYLERRLQNVTNYFLMSLAITDLLVAILVMPLGILTLVRGKITLTYITNNLMKYVKNSTIAMNLYERMNRYWEVTTNSVYPQGCGVPIPVTPWKN